MYRVFVIGTHSDFSTGTTVPLRALGMTDCPTINQAPVDEKID